MFDFDLQKEKNGIFILEEELIPTTTRQAKSKALETLSISHNKRRLETESDLNEEQEDNRRRTTSLSRHVSTNLRRRTRSDKVSHRKTSKRHRSSSSDEDEEEEDRPSKKSSEGTDTGNLCVRRRAGKKFSSNNEIFSIHSNIY